MRRQKQLFRHDSDNGIWGDCYRTAIACILDLDREEVPHFYDNDADGEQGRAATQEWMQARGLYLIEFAVVANDDLGAALHGISSMNPGLPFLLSGVSANGCNHVVVCLDGEIVHDPAIDNSGIVGPQDDGCYWLMFIGADISECVRDQVAAG